MKVKILIGCLGGRTGHYERRQNKVAIAKLLYKQNLIKTLIELAILFYFDLERRHSINLGWQNRWTWPWLQQLNSSPTTHGGNLAHRPLPVPPTRGQAYYKNDAYA